MTIPPDSHVLRQALWTRILHGLSCEWDLAVLSLPAGIRKKMRRPLFGLREMAQRLGVWDSAKREIALSREFVLTHPWKAVREVLHHETAHQVAFEVLGGSMEVSHGPSFQEACRFLRIDGKAAARYCDLEGAAVREEADGVLLKIKKLLALAESPNVHEAEAAMHKAHALIRKHNVDLIRLNQDRAFVSTLVGAPSLRQPRDQYMLANLLQEFYFVSGVWVPVYVVEKGKMGRMLELSGTSGNVETAAYVHDYIRHFIEGQWRLFSRGKGYGLRQKVDYASGILEGFRRKLASPGAEAPDGKMSRDLISLKDPLLTEYMAGKYPHLRSFRRGGGKVDAGVLDAGRAAGAALVIARGVTASGESGKLIPG